MEYTREQLVSICERAVVPYGKWRDRDSAGAQQKLGMAWVLLKAGCPFSVRTKENTSESHCVTDERTIWLVITFPGFAFFEDETSGYSRELFYIPTEARLEATKGWDWY